MSAKTVFISYRREPVGESLAGRLTTELKHQGYDVFLDVTSMRAGPFSEQIEKEVQTRSHFILVVTPNSLERCSRPDDWIRREFELAVKHKRNIVPVVADSADWSTESGHLEKLSGYQRQILKHDSFQNDVSELIVRFLSLEVPPLDLTISSDKTIRPPGTRIPPSHWRAVTIGFIDYLRLKASRIQMFEQWPGLSQPLVRGFKTPHYEFASRGTLVSPNKRVLIVNGPAGAGKTTYIDQLSKQLIKRTPNPDVDLFVHLRAAELEEAVKQSDYPVLWQLIYSFFFSQGLRGQRPLTPAAVAYALTKKRILIMIEDLHWAVSTTAALQFCQSYFAKYHKNAGWRNISILGTTRETWEKLSELEGQTQTLEPIGQRDAQLFFWHLCKENAPEINLTEHGEALGKAFDAPSLQEPLFVEISASLVAHPSGSRLDVGRVLQMTAPELFDAFIEKLYKRSELVGKVDYEAFRTAYEDLAHVLWPLQGNFDELTATRLVSPFSAQNKHFTVRSLEANGFLRRDPLGYLSFPHHSMAEFLTAASMVRRLEFSKLTENDQGQRISGLIPFLAALIKPPEVAILEKLANTNLWLFLETVKHHQRAVSKREAISWRIPAIAIAKAAGEWARSTSGHSENYVDWEALRDLLDSSGLSGWRAEFAKAARGATSTDGSDVVALGIVGGEDARHVLLDRLKGPNGTLAFGQAIKTTQIQSFLLKLIETAGLQSELGMRSFAVLATVKEPGLQKLFTDQVSKNYHQLKEEDIKSLLKIGKDGQRALGYACQSQSIKSKRDLCAYAARHIQRLLVPPGRYDIHDQIGTQKSFTVKKPVLIACHPERAGQRNFVQTQNYIARKVGSKKLLTIELAAVLQQHFEHILNEILGPNFADPQKGEYEAFLEGGKVGLFYFYSDGFGRIRIGSMPDSYKSKDFEVVYHTAEEL